LLYSAASEASRGVAKFNDDAVDDAPCGLLLAEEELEAAADDEDIGRTGGVCGRLPEMSVLVMGEVLLLFDDDGLDVSKA
jgi:hypothetical protein